MVGSFLGLKPFLSTPSARRATLAALHVASRDGISIHALREEGDINPEPDDAATDNFYPRPPRGGRRSPKISS